MKAAAKEKETAEANNKFKGNQSERSMRHQGLQDQRLQSDQVTNSHVIANDARYFERQETLLSAGSLSQPRPSVKNAAPSRE